MVQADPAKLRGFGQVGPGAGIEHRQPFVGRVLEVAHPRIGHQHRLATAEELVEQRQVGAIVEHIRDDDQVVAVGLGEEVLRIA